MTLAEYDARMRQAAIYRTVAENNKAWADKTEADTLKEAGIQHIPRSAGLPGWTHRHLVAYYHDPREVIISLEKFLENLRAEVPDKQYSAWCGIDS